MPLVFAAVCSHAPGITGRAHLADAAVKDEFHAQFDRLGAALRDSRPDAVIVIAAEHFANFFMNNMPAYAMGMADRYEGPIEDPTMARHREDDRARRRRAVEADHLGGDADRRRRVCRRMEVRPRHHRAAALSHAGIRCAGDPGQHQLPGSAAHSVAARLGLRRSLATGVPIACAGAHRDRRHRRYFALAGHAGLRQDQRGHGIARSWIAGAPTIATPCCRPSTTTTRATYREAGQGGFEIRTFIAVAAAARGQGAIFHMKAIPIFAVTCTAAVMAIH